CGKCSASCSLEDSLAYTCTTCGTTRPTRSAGSGFCGMCSAGFGDPRRLGTRCSEAIEGSRTCGFTFSPGGKFVRFWKTVVLRFSTRRLWLLIEAAHWIKEDLPGCTPTAG